MQDEIGRWPLVSSAYILTEPETWNVRWDASDYSGFAVQTTVFVYQPRDPLADGRNGRSTEDTVWEIDYNESTRNLPVATEEMREKAKELRPIPKMVVRLSQVV